MVGWLTNGSSSKNVVMVSLDHTRGIRRQFHETVYGLFHDGDQGFARSAVTFACLGKVMPYETSLLSAFVRSGAVVKAQERRGFAPEESHLVASPGRVSA